MYLVHALMTIISKMSKVCSQIVLKFSFLARIGRPGILWSVNKFARSITKWTKACDKRLSGLISYIHHTCEYEQYCHVGKTAKQCRLGLFQDSDFAGDLEDSKSTSVGTLCFRKPIRSKWLDVQETRFSLAQLNMIRNHLGCRFKDGRIPALDLWDLNVIVLHGNTNQSKQAQGEGSFVVTSLKTTKQ